MIIGVNDMISLSQDTTEQQPEPSSRHLYSKFQTIQCLDNIDDEKEDSLGIENCHDNSNEKVNNDENEWPLSLNESNEPLPTISKDGKRLMELQHENRQIKQRLCKCENEIKCMQQELLNMHDTDDDESNYDGERNELIKKLVEMKNNNNNTKMKTKGATIATTKSRRTSTSSFHLPAPLPPPSFSSSKGLKWTAEEDAIIIHEWKNKKSGVAFDTEASKYLNGRSKTAVKTRWYTYLKHQKDQQLYISEQSNQSKPMTRKGVKFNVREYDNDNYDYNDYDDNDDYDNKDNDNDNDYDDNDNDINDNYDGNGTVVDVHAINMSQITSVGASVAQIMTSGNNGVHVDTNVDTCVDSKMDVNVGVTANGCESGDSGI